ncbi:uncharacterized protein LOC118197172 [Stegodyphus dumicola]|uniref:uncharacterized protein LOC118197172 n=1 Tax=Stegodyphus dumicola TaxID=202533 RepID=UPI0015ABD3F3|nr:uncharacterized protein LOC118197172 [Stegodyphus dumicola]
MSASVTSIKMYQRSIMTKPQQQMILQYMEKHPDLFRGKITKEFTPQMKLEMWEDLATLLNERGPCVKTTEKWRRTFIDWKCAVKKKAAEIAAVEKQTAGRPVSVKELSDDEMRLVNLMNNAANAEIEAMNETDEEILTFPGIQISQVYSNCIPVIDPVQMNWEPPSEITSTNILETQIKLEPTDSVKNLNKNLIGDGLIQKSIDPTSEPALGNVLEAQVKLEQTDICDTNSTPIIHKITNENFVTNETPQKNLKPISEACVVLEQSGTLSENSEQVTYAVASNHPNGKEPLQNLKLTPESVSTHSFQTHMKLRPVNGLRENSEKEAFEITNQNSSAIEPPLKKLKPASETVLTTALEVDHENLRKMPRVITNGNLHPPRRKLKPSSSVTALQNVMEAQIKMGKQMDTLNENLEKMTNAITGLTKAITNSCQLIFAVLDKNYAIQNKN